MFRLFFLFVPLFSIGCDEMSFLLSDHKNVKATKIQSISKPSNFRASSSCNQYWRSFEEAALKMDKYSDNWNEVVVQSAMSLFEECLKATEENCEKDCKSAYEYKCKDICDDYDIEQCFAICNF